MGVFTPEDAVFHEYEIPTFGSLPGDMVIDHKRSMLWFTEGNTEAKRLGVLSIADALAQSKQEDAAAQESLAKKVAPEADTARDSSRWLLYLVLAVVIVLGACWLRRLKRQPEGGNG